MRFPVDKLSQNDRLHNSSADFFNKLILFQQCINYAMKIFNWKKIIQSKVFSDFQNNSGHIYRFRFFLRIKNTHVVKYTILMNYVLIIHTYYILKNRLKWETRSLINIAQNFNGLVSSYEAIP